MAIDPDTLSGWGTAYAALVATGVLALEVRRWIESGAKLNVTAVVGVMLYPRAPGEEKRYISVRVANRGDTATTLTNLGLVWYRSWFHQVVRTGGKYFVVVQASTAQPIPFLLETGGHWVGLAILNDEIESLLAKGRLLAEVYASHTDKPTRLRLRKRKEPRGTPLAGAA